MKRAGFITVAEALKIWNTKAVYAYDQAQKVDWQVNHANEFRSAYLVIQECIDNDTTLFTDND